MRLILTLLFSISVASAGVDFQHPTSWAEAQTAARTQGKFLFLDAYTEWCSWCKVMDRETFSKDEVAAIMNKEFVNVKMEMETGGGIDVAMKYRIHGFPQFLIFDKQGKLVYRITGYMPAEPFIEELKKALDPTSQMSFPGISSKMDLPYPDFLRQSYVAGKDRKFAEQSVVEAWLDGYDNLGDEVSWTVMSRMSMSERYQNWILEHADELTAKYGSEYESERFSIAAGRASAAVAAKDEQQLESALALLPSDHPSKPAMSAVFEMRLAAAKEDWSTMADILVRSYDSGSINNSTANEYAWMMFEECPKVEALQKAADVMKHVCQDAGWAEWDTWASLLFKIGDYDKAEMVAVQAIELGTASDQNVSATKELLEKIRNSR
jgi:thioredoxin-related protein